MDVTPLQQARELIKAGRTSEARRILTKLIDVDPYDVNAWFWLVETMPDDDQRVAVLEQCLRFNHGNRKALAGIERFSGRVPRSAPSIQAVPDPTAKPPDPSPFTTGVAPSQAAAPVQPEQPQPVPAVETPPFQEPATKPEKAAPAPVKSAEHPPMEAQRKASFGPSEFWGILLILLILAIGALAIYAVVTYDLLSIFR